LISAGCQREKGVLRRGEKKKKKGNRLGRDAMAWPSNLRRFRKGFMEVRGRLCAKKIEGKKVQGKLLASS